jgi:TctA family transporter
MENDSNILHKENNFFTANKLKMIAIILMLLDHFVVIFIQEESVLHMVLRIPGRIVSPIICFLISEGYHYTSNRKNYIFRLFVLAVVSHIPFNIAFNHSLSPLEATSVIWALVMGLVALTALKSDIPVALKPLILVLCCIAAYTANWNFIAVLWIVAFGLFHGNFKRQMLAFCVVGIVCNLMPSYLRYIFSSGNYLHWYQLGIFLAVPFLALYSGKLGKKSKAMSYSFYVFYPMHLILLFILNHYTPLAEMIGRL